MFKSRLSLDGARWRIVTEWMSSGAHVSPKWGSSAWKIWTPSFSYLIHPYQSDFQRKINFSKYMIYDIWFHAYGRSMGSLHIFWHRDRNIPYAYPKGFHKVQVWAPWGSMWISYGLGNIRMIMFAGTMRFRADATYGLGNIHIISRAGPYCARWVPWVHLRIIFIR